MSKMVSNLLRKITLISRSNIDVISANELSELGCAWDKTKATEATRALQCCPWHCKEGYGVLVQHKGRKKRVEAQYNHPQ